MKEANTRKNERKQGEKDETLKKKRKKNDKKRKKLIEKISMADQILQYFTLPQISFITF